jgi:hypothetical protein
LTALGNPTGEYYHNNPTSLTSPSTKKGGMSNGSKFKSLSLSMQGGIHEKDQSDIGIYDNIIRQQNDAVMVNRNKKIKDAARIQGQAKSKNNSVNRNSANMHLLTSSAQYASNKRYESSVKTTNVGSSAAQSQL